MKKLSSVIIIALLSLTAAAQDPVNRCTISYNYESGTGWNTDRHYFTNTCPGLSWLPGSTPQGTHQFNGGQLQFNTIQDASMNRIYRSFTPVLGNSFIADFEARVNNNNNGFVGYALLALTQNDNAPLYDFSSSCPIIPTANNAIMVYVGNAVAGGAMDVSVMSKFNTTLSTVPTGFAMANNTTYYFRLKRETVNRVTFEVFSDANRANLLLRKSCIDIDGRISGLKTIQHANNPAGGLNRMTSGYIDNVCITVNPDFTCCTPRISGNNTICEAATPATYQLNAVTGNTYTWMLPADVSYTTNAANTQITITSWGQVNAIPKQVDIKVKMYCHCDSFIVSYPVFVYPARDPSFNFQNLGNNGGSLTNFQAVGNVGVAGTINHWEMYNSNVSGAEIGNPIRNTFWQTSTGPGTSTYNIIANGSLISGPPFPANVTFPFVNLQTGRFYVIKHGMYYEGNTCDWKGSSRVIYIGSSFKVINLGDPQTPEFRLNLEQLKKTETLKAL